MTSNVKSWRENSHDVFCMLRSSLVMWCIGRAGASNIRRLILLISVGWRPPYLSPSGACLNLGTSVPSGSLNAVEDCTIPGLRLFRLSVDIAVRLRSGPIRTRWLRDQGDLFGNGPHKGDEFTGNGHHDLIGVFTASAELSVPFTQPYLRFPTDVLDRFWKLFQA
jgi:hypothetical protein